MSRRAESSSNRCVCCGAEIPEGRQVCPACDRNQYSPGEFFSAERRRGRSDTISREAAMRAFTEDQRAIYTLAQIVAILDALPATEEKQPEAATAKRASGPGGTNGRSCSGVCVGRGFTCHRLRPDFSCEFDGEEAAP